MVCDVVTIMIISDYINTIDRNDVSIHIPDKFFEKIECTNGILLFSHDLTRTGAPLQLLELAKALCELGYQPFVYSLRDGYLIDSFLNINVPVICENASATAYEWIDKLVKEFDTIFINTLVLADYIRYFSNKSKRIFWWIHENSYYFTIDQYINIPTYENLTILAASEKAQEHIIKYMNLQAAILNVCVKDYGISYKSPSDKAFFLWSGTLDLNKAPQVLFKAILELPPEYLDSTEFIVIGDIKNHEYDIIVKLLSSKLDNIHFLTNMDHNDFLNMFDKVDAVIVTSIEETTSMVAVEGLMKQKAVICSEGCGVARYIEPGKNGFVFPTRDYVILSDLIQYVADNNQSLDSLKKSGRLLYEKIYSFEIFRQNLKKILESSKSVCN